MKFTALRFLLVGLVVIAMTTVVASTQVAAQCATCPTAMVAYSPVVAQPVVAYKPYTGWYPGKLLDRMRLRRAGVDTATAYTATYAPSYTAAYAPAYTTSYAPSYTAAYRPYYTAYAPLSVPVVQTVARPVLMRPVMAAPVCNTCQLSDCACNTCSSCATQAVYTEPACSSCATGSVSSGQNFGPQTPQPGYSSVPEPADSTYDANRPESEASEGDPGPGVDPNTYNAPLLLNPADRTVSRTRKPTVDVRTAVYHKPAPVRKASTRVRTQAEIDADGWTAVSE